MDIFEPLADEASNLVYFTKNSSFTAREILTATQLVLNGELAKHAISEGTKSLNKYNASIIGAPITQNDDNGTQTKTISVQCI